jgi:hypothetical protein
MPNPFQSSLTVRFETYQEGRVQVELRDVSGRVEEILLEDLLAAGPHEIVWLPAGRLAAGVYILNVRGAEGATGAKIVHLPE